MKKPQFVSGNRAEVRTQAELEVAIAAQAWPIVLVGNGQFTVTGSSHVEAWGSSSVVAWGSSHVEAWGSSSVEARESSSVVAWESSSVVAWGSSHVEAWGSSSVVAWGSSHVVAWESSSVEARESSSVEAAKFVAVQTHPDHTGQVTGGVVIAIPAIASIDDWCAYRGVAIANGVVTLYKAVRDDFRSSRGFLYAPGTAPVAPDWDGDARECGGGLHFCAHPLEALNFDDGATRFLACPVAVADIRTPRPDDQYPQKVKAARICGPIVEVDRYGDPVPKAGESSYEC